MTDAWVDRLEAWLRDFYQPWGTNVTVNNGAVPGERAPAVVCISIGGRGRSGGRRGPCERALARALCVLAPTPTLAFLPGPPHRCITQQQHHKTTKGTTSAFMCACFRRHVPSDADVVFIEYAVNDDEHKAPAFNNNVRCDPEVERAGGGGG